MKKFTFTEEQRKQVEEAVKDAERASSGEIVPYFVGSSDDYSEASWYGSAMLGMISSVMIAVLSFYWLLPFEVTPFEVAAFILGSLILGFILPMIFPPLKRWLISDDVKKQRVMQRARQAFLDEKVFQTEDRVGILIFVSRFEHKVLVLGDVGISAKVDESQWKELVSAVITGIKQKQVAEGLVKAIGLGKDLLLKHGFVRKSKSTNELSDELRLG